MAQFYLPHKSMSIRNNNRFPFDLLFLFEEIPICKKVANKINALTGIALYLSDN